MTKEEAKNIIQKLVERFREHREEYHLPDYNETKTRRDFIDPFFKALGWDIDNEQGFAEAYREVIHEDKTRVHGKLKAPDYGFRMNGSDKRLFFVEAKKPSVPLKVNKESAYQIRRYGRSAYTPVSILTNFEEFIVYDCTKRPNYNDSASNARLKLINFEQYASEFDFIYDTFSREAVAKGRFDKFVQSDTHKKGTQTLDKDFVASLDEWRIYLAKSIVSSNKKINEEELNYAVQQTIDRLIFLRFCEDRAVEQYGQLQKAVQIKGNAYNHLIDLFKQADDKYNSGLFDFKKDTITPGLKIPDKVFEYIISELYYPKCEYEFSVMPVEILGNAYEQFLGKVIRITPGHSARIEQKPEVRKAGGVFYTPQYIVEYIVKNTVGKLIEGKTPKEIEKIKIVDPACGSGSFLLGAFHYLLNYHANWYIQKGYLDKKGNNNPLSPSGVLTTIEKKKILLNNIFGVDIDANAVEVTKLSLLLKCMDGETAASVKQQLSVFHERVLPDLDNNIKCGNSLVDFDDELNFGEEKKLKPFNWKQAFPDVFKKRPSAIDATKQELKEHYNKVKDQATASNDLLDKLSGKVEEPIVEYGDAGGFDVVIGNPPYVRQELLADYKEYFEKHYRVFHGAGDLYTYFIEKGKSLLREDGYFGVIVANKWMRANYGEPLRKWLKQIDITEITDFGDLPVFQGAIAYPCILIYRNSFPSKHFKVANIKTLQFSTLEKIVNESQTLVHQDGLDDTGWNLSSENEQNLAFVIDYETRKKLIQEDKKCVEIIKPFLAGRDIKRYQLPQSDKFLIITIRGMNIANYPSIKNHLHRFKKKLEARAGKQAWYELQASPDNLIKFESPKIMYPDIALRAQAIYDKKGFFSVNTVYNIGIDDKYLLAIINSNLFQYYFSSITNSIQGGYLRFFSQYVETVPVPIVSEKTKTEIIKYVDALLASNEELKVSKLQSNVEQLKQHIAHSEEKINQLVYELYNLTKEEIKIIEEK
ncbi:MAG: Eco57I restriction-modification methylase domain-containing protein [Bacteroidetes bacterium]|nr:Eco57I restriction-modification methylase domain-containing protein [Bacteroidota bacterium]